MPATLTPPPASPRRNARTPRMLKDFAPASNVRVADQIAKIFICLFGLLVIASVVLILVFVGREALPIFYSPRSEKLPLVQMPTSDGKTHLLTWNVDQFQKNSYGISDEGYLDVYSNTSGKLEHHLPIEPLVQDVPTQAWSASDGKHFLIVATSGKIIPLQIEWLVTYDASQDMVLTPDLQVQGSVDLPEGFVLSKEGWERMIGCYSHSTDQYSIALLTHDGRVLAGTYAAMGSVSSLAEVQGGIPPGGITGMVIDEYGRQLLIASDQNWIYRWNLDKSTTEPVEKIQPSDKGSYVSSLNILIGSTTFVFGYADGRVEGWFEAQQDESQGGGTRIRRIHQFESHQAAVVGISPSSVNRGFWTYDVSGGLKMHFSPSCRKLYSFHTQEAIVGCSMNGQLNGLSVLSKSGKILQWKLDNPHPDINLDMLFGKVMYEGYSTPQYIWQSSSGSDSFEAKFSMIPLILGTLKGAFYGLIFAVPIAVLASIYTSQLMHPRIRSVIKPTIEIMAALPSVVIGFLAGLWLAPFMETHLVAVTVAVPLSILLVLVGAVIYFTLPQGTRGRIPAEVELGLIFAMVFIAVLISGSLGPSIETHFFNSNIQQWIYDRTGQTIEQRNCLVIGLAMGFAVIPIIFSISDDALSNVPRHYMSGSLALGATRWQSAIRVILPTASPGIFSAIMLGFGRAVGETMIVLMATGNTPILSFSPFNGMRTLSANIAVEIPEAPFGGTHYRVLFLGAVLLFLVTFVVNTGAEVIRIRLRDRYRAM